MRGRLWVGVLVTWLSGTSVAVADRVLDRPAFSAAPSELLALASTAPAGDWPVVLLRDQHDVSYDDKGRATVRWRMVFVVRTRAGVDGWGTARAEWRPFYQDRPQVRARVIEPAGELAELDPSLIADAPATQPGAPALSDRRRLEAPLPRLQVGAVVEEEIVTVDREPMLAAGTIDTTPIGGDVPTLSTVLSYAAPAARKVHHVARRLPAGVRPRHEIAGGRESWVYDIGPLPALPPREADVPGDVVVQPYIGVGTAASWTAVARGFRALIDERIAEGPVGVPADIPRVASIDTVNAIADWMRRRVRYTGIELGQASNVPWPPAQTVKRGFGDCKDLAALMVALLRQAGMRADVALLDAGPGLDVDPDLPGAGGFDHAIVRARLDGRDLWIDPTEELMRPGELPARDRGRRVLIVADDTRGLSTTPGAASGDNVFREVRTFIASEDGPSQVTHAIRFTGMFERNSRWWFRDTRADEVKKTYEAYAQSVYGGTLDRATSTAAADLAIPFEATLAVKDSQRVFTDRDRIYVRLDPGAALEEIPQAVTEGAAGARTQDFAWPTPQVHEVEHRIVVPHGFTLPTSSDSVRAVGPATWTERRRIEGDTLVVDFRFDSGKPRWTAGELAALHEALPSLREEIHIDLEQTAGALVRAGKPREALAECRRLIAEHPRQAAHHSQLAIAYLGASAGEAARRAAREAVALAPAQGDPYSVLGWVLSHDTLGRSYIHDWDRAGAIAAYRKALELDPRHQGALDGLTEALIRDPLGRVLESGSDARGAIEVVRGSLRARSSDGHALKLARLLSWVGQFYEAEQVARIAQPTEDRDKVIVAAVAGAQGAKQAIRLAGELRSGAIRTQLLEYAAGLMLLRQRYGVARELLADGDTGLSSAISGMLERLTARPAIASGTADPRSAVVDVLAAAVDRHRKTPAFWDAALERAARARLRRMVALPPWGTSTRLVEDWLGAAVIQIEGEGGVWRATVEGMGERGRLYLALDHGIVKLVGAPELPSGIGRYLLATAGAPNGEARARRLLDWLRADLDPAADEATFRKVWSGGPTAPRDAVRVAAAVLARSTDAERAMAVASRCPSTRPDFELACLEILAEGHLAREHWSEALSQIEALERRASDRAPSFATRHAWLLGRLGRLDAADKLLEDHFAKDPGSRDALAARMRAAEAAGQMQLVLQRGEALARHPGATPADLNGVAWAQLGTNDDLGAALQLVRKAIQARNSASFVNTLAAIEAERGDVDAAVHDNWKVMELAGTVEPLDSDWYVAGRIYEQLGLATDAAAAYKRIAPSTDVGVTLPSLAQRRLAAMQAKRAP
jgi:tetratricopeptide (TPR) repeat protein